MAKTIPPHANELELSLFGPGIGECVVVHLGAGNWMTIDSCLNHTGETAIALDYLDALGVDVANQIKLVVVTHWHDDHICGVSQLVQSATSARFACSAALRSEEFCTLLAADDHIKLVEHTSGVSEFSYVLEILETRSGSRHARGPDHWVTDGMVLYSETLPCSVQVYSLSPSPQTFTDSHAQIARLIPSLRQSLRRLPSASPNALSIVLLVKTAGLHFLLGADLERGPDERRGWQAVIGSKLRPRVASSAYKVAHHGSENADVDGIWSELLVKNCRAVLTPYARGSKPLPSNDDVARIKAKTAHLYSTVWPPTTRPPKRRGVDRTMDEVTRTRRAIRSRPGHIRIRGPVEGNLDDLSVELFDGAVQL